MQDMKEENYVFIDRNNQFAFIKPSNYELSKKRKYQKDISRIESLLSKTNSYVKMSKNVEVKYEKQ